MKRTLLATVISVACLSPTLAWAGCDPPGGGYGNCPPPTPAPAGGNASASATSHATAGAAASVTSTNRNTNTATNTNRIVIRNVVNTGGGSGGSTPPLTALAPLAQAAAAPVAPTTPAASSPAADPAADPSHTHQASTSPGGGRHGNGSGGGYYYSNNSTEYHEPVATAYAPSFGTVNPCVGSSASAGLQTTMVGVSFGGQRMDVQCQMLRLGTDTDMRAARNYLCIRDEEVARAYATVGVRCPENPPVQAVSTYVAPVAAPVARADRPKWCATVLAAHPGDTYPQCM